MFSSFLNFFITGPILYEVAAIQKTLGWLVSVRDRIILVIIFVYSFLPLL